MIMKVRTFCSCSLHRQPHSSSRSAAATTTVSYQATCRACAVAQRIAVQPSARNLLRQREHQRIGHASFQVATFNVCGFGCLHRNVTFDDGSTLDPGRGQPSGPRLHLAGEFRPARLSAARRESSFWRSRRRSSEEQVGWRARAGPGAAPSRSTAASRSQDVGEHHALEGRVLGAWATALPGVSQTPADQEDRLFARMTIFDNIDLSLERRRSSASTEGLRNLEGAPGCQGLLTLVDRDDRRLDGIGFYDSAESARRAEELLGHVLPESDLEDLGRALPRRATPGCSR